MENLSNFGETLKELISDKNMDPNTFANIVNIDLSVIYRYFRNECMPTLKNFIVIADYFNCSSEYLLGLTVCNPDVVYKQAPPFSQRFKELLAEKNVTRYRLRKECEFARQSVDDWYYGKYSPTMDNIFRLKDYFDCTLDELLGRE